MANFHLTRPQFGQQTTIANTSEDRIVLDFPATESTVGREGNALTFTFEDGAKITLDGFYTDYTSENTPEFIVDGQMVSGKDFFSALGQDDLMPAAGPTTATRNAHYTEHADSSLDSGIDHLGGLDWSMQTASVVQDTLAMDSQLVRDDGGQGPDAPGTGGGGVTPSDYHTRLVVGNDTSQSMVFQAIDENGNLVTDASQLSLAFAGGSSAYFNAPVVDPVTGLVTITLTAAGQAALAAGEKFDSVLEVTVGGKTYKMELLGNDSSSYDSAQREAETDLGGPLKGEWYDSHGKNVNGEKITLGGEDYNSAVVENTTASGNAYGALNTDITFAHDAAGKIDISSKAENGNAYGTSAYGRPGGGTITIDAGTKGDVNMGASADGGSSMALITGGDTDGSGNFYQATANVHGKDITFTAGSNERTAAGIWGGGKSTVNVQAEGDVNFSSSVTGGTVNYMATSVYTKDQAVVNISGQNVSGETNAYKGGGADGTVMSSVFRTTAGTAINIDTASDGKFSATAYQETSPYDSPYTGVSWTGGRAAGFTSLGLAASGNLNQAGQGGKSAININTGDVDISATVDAASPKGTAAAIYAGYGGDVKINTSGTNNELNITADAPSWGVSIFSTNYGTTTINTGAGDDIINLNASAHNGAAAIGLAAQASGQTIINGGDGNDTLNINAIFTGTHTLSTDYMGGTPAGAFGMNAAWGGAFNKISNIENVNITADASGSATGWAYGMYAHEDWHGAVKNIIESTDSPITVVITAKAGTAGQAYAMYGVQNASNIIQGGSKAGDAHGDSITLTGDIGGSYNTANTINTGSGDDHIEINGNLRDGKNTFNMGDGNDIFTLNGNIAGGTNKIVMGTGDSHVNIHGDVTGGSTSISLGAGNDVVTLDGHVQGNLSITGGDGYDLLVLKADSYADFIAKYDTWLQNNLSSIDVEGIHVSVNGLSATDQADLHAYLNNGHFNGYDVTYSDSTVPFSAAMADDLPDGYREAGLSHHGDHDGGSGHSGGDASTLSQDAHSDSVSDDMSTLAAQHQIHSEFGG